MQSETIRMARELAKYGLTAKGRVVDGVPTVVTTVRFADFHIDYEIFREPKNWTLRVRSTTDHKDSMLYVMRNAPDSTIVVGTQKYALGGLFMAVNDMLEYVRFCESHARNVR